MRLPRRVPSAPVGLYDPANEHDACGVGFVAHLSGEPVRERCVPRARRPGSSMDHRGAAGLGPRRRATAPAPVADPRRACCASVRAVDLPAPGPATASAVCFLPARRGAPSRARARVAGERRRRGPGGVGWRDVPVEPDEGRRAVARRSRPVIRQLFIGPGGTTSRATRSLERRLYLIRRAAEHASGDALVVPSCSARTIVYKGMLAAHQLIGFYPDLRDERWSTALAVVHSRFSTNTFPSWRSPSRSG